VNSYSTTMSGAEINVFLTGIGGANAWQESSNGIGDTRYQVLISSGLAGALKPEHKVREVLAAESICVAHELNVVCCDSQLVEIAAACGAKKVKHFYSADHVVVGAKEKQELSVNADAVEMESGQLLRWAAARGSRGIAVRAISDEVGEDLPLDFNQVTTRSGALSIPRVLGQVARRPTTIPSLIRFGQQSRLAAESLAQFLDRYLNQLATLDPGFTEEGAKKA